MAKRESPGIDGERLMFAPANASFALSRDPDAPPDLPAGPAPPFFPPAGVAPAKGSMVAGITARLHRPVAPTRETAARSVRRALATEIDRGIAFIIAPVLMASGAMVYFSLGEEPGFPAIAACCGFLAASVHAARAKPVLNMMLAAVLLVAAGVALAKLETWRAGTRMLGSEVPTRLTGRVVEIERLADGRRRLTIDVLATERPALRYSPARVRVSARRVPDAMQAGSVATGLVRLLPPSGPVRPGSYDFSFQSYFDGIGASGFFLRGPELGAPEGSVSALGAFMVAIERLRNAAADRISGRIGGAEGEIAAALVVGVRAGIPDDVNEALRRAGIYHIISISGLHMALVAGTIMLLLRSGFALFPDFSSRHPVKKYAAAFAIVGLAGYLFISGAEVAAQRSFIMLAVMLVAVLFDCAALTLRNLAIAACVVIALSPHEVVGPSFQMSFAATAALVGAYAWWGDWRADHPRETPTNRSLARRAAQYVVAAMFGLAMTSIVAGGATAIYAAWHFQQMPSLGLFTNLAAMPIVSVMVMPFAVLGTLAMPFGLDGPFFEIMGLGLSATIAIARWFADRSPLDLVGPVPAGAVAAFTVALLLATILSTWLRLLAAPVALAGLLLLMMDRPRPDLLVSEDGRLAGLAIDGGRVAINRSRPGEFTMENWKRALTATEVVGPAGRQNRPATGEAANAADGPAGRATDVARPPSAPGFACADGLCFARHPTGAVIVHALDGQAALDACAIASVVVVEDPSAENVCRSRGVLVITGRDLARQGSAAITLAAGSAPRVDYAIARPYRPWHDHRRFSRAARGLPPHRTAAAKPDDAPEAGKRPGNASTPRNTADAAAQ